MVGFSFQPTSSIKTNTEPRNLCLLYHSESHRATFEKVFPVPFLNNITKVMLLTHRTVKSKQHYYTRNHRTRERIYSSADSEYFIFGLTQVVAGELYY